MSDDIRISSAFHLSVTICHSKVTSKLVKKLTDFVCTWETNEYSFRKENYFYYLSDRERAICLTLSVNVFWL